MSATAKSTHGVLDVSALRKALGDKFLFAIERNIDRDIVVYEAELNDAKDEITGVTQRWCKMDNFAETEPVSDGAKTMFYGVALKRVKRGHFLMSLNCFSDEPNNRIVSLHIKKSGKVVPKVIIGKKECVLNRIYTDITKMPPSINGLWIQGDFEGEIVEEEIKVSDSIMDRVNLDDFLPKLV